MPSGTVKWFNNAKGFGFILPEDGGSDLFAHYSSIEMEGYRTLKAGQSVTFEVEQGDKGLHASHIKAKLEGDTSDIKRNTEQENVSSAEESDERLAEAH